MHDRTNLFYNFLLIIITDYILNYREKINMVRNKHKEYYPNFKIYDTVDFSHNI